MRKFRSWSEACLEAHHPCSASRSLAPSENLSFFLPQFLVEFLQNKMFSLSRIPGRASRSPICAHCLRQMTTRRPLLTPSASSITPSISPVTPRTALLSFCQTPLFRSQQRTYAEKTSADDIIEEIQEQYATARDEFEIATEETEKKSVYAADDRAAAREELNNLKEMFQKAIEGEDGEEVKRRIGQRIRELDNAVEALEKSAIED